jgi:O-antigen ligase
MDIMLVIAGLIGLLWGGVVLLRGGLMAGSLLVLLAGTCFGYPFFNIPGGPIPITLDRALFGVLLVQLVVWWRSGRTNSTPIVKSDLVAALFMFALLASVFMHDWRVNNSQPLSRFVFFYGMPFGMYWVARRTIQTPRSTIVMHGCFAVFGAYLALTAIAETRGWTALVFPRYISAADPPEFLGRGRGPFLNPAACGLFQAVCLCAALVWWPRLTQRGRTWVLALTCLTLVGIYATLTRSAWMGGALSLLIVAAALVPSRWRLPLTGGVILAGSIVVATQWENLISFQRDKNLTAAETAQSAQLRPILAAIAWKMFLDHPVFGVGFGQYLETNTEYTEDRSSDLPLSVGRPYVQHNAWLSLLTETGLVGMGLFIVLMVLWTKHAWQLWRRTDIPDWIRRQALWFLAILGAYVPNAMFQDVSIIPMVNMLLFFAAGLTEALSAAVTMDDEQAARVAV